VRCSEHRERRVKFCTDTLQHPSPQLVMRFGKKLALKVNEDNTGAPYLSHKHMKEAINRTVRELRIYQSRLQDFEQARQGIVVLGGEPVVSAAELVEQEKRICTLDRQLFSLVDEDLAQLFSQVRLGEAKLQDAIAEVQEDCMHNGIIVEESKLLELEQKLPVKPDSSTSLCIHLIDLQMRCDPRGVAMKLLDVSAKYNCPIDLVNEHSQYLEINVAGFRKLLKRHEKQIPTRFRSRPMPYLDFHRLVTHASRQLLGISKQVGDVITDAWQRLTAGAVNAGTAVPMQPEMTVLKGLGPECEMVLSIQKALTAGPSQQLVGSLAVLGNLYPKPEVKQQQQSQQQQQQQQQPSSQRGSGTLW